MNTAAARCRQNITNTARHCKLTRTYPGAVTPPPPPQCVWACTCAAVPSKERVITFEHLAALAKLLEAADPYLPNAALPVYYLLGAMAVLST